MYRWKCPYCNTSRSSSGEVKAEAIKKRAKHAIYGHVSSSNGAGHGPQYSVPENFDPECHLERVGE